MVKRVSALLFACTLFACKQRGTVSIDLTLNTMCQGSQLAVYFIPGECPIDGCGSACSCTALCRNTCQLGCVGGPCNESELKDGIVITPPAAGTYALVIDILSQPEAGPSTVIGETCATVHIQSDGTMSENVPLTPVCCTP
jgi:hypothetical protein